MTRKKISLFALALVVFFELLLILRVPNINKSRKIPSNPAPGLQLSDLQRENKIWSKNITSLGAEKAYEKFKETYKDFHFGDQHALAHMFGVLLYGEMGIGGVSVCDKTFAFGCYHSFFGAAISENGIEVIEDLDEACISKWGPLGLGCQHGIGHGILTSLGESNLLESLEACNTLTWKGPIGGCTSGVYMEYNFRTMADPSGVQYRSLDENNPHFPCSDLPTKFLEGCYWDLTQWWKEVYRSDFKKIGSLCNELNTNLQKDACFRGTGNVIGPATNFDPDLTIEACKKMPDFESQVRCREGASWSFFSQPKFTNLAPLICEGLPSETVHRCIEGSDVFNLN